MVRPPSGATIASPAPSGRRLSGNRTGRRRKAGAIVAMFAAVIMAGCASGGKQTQTVATLTPTSSTLSPMPSPSPSPSRTPTLATCAAPVTRTALHVVHHFSVSPDDIAVDGSGRLWVTARSANQLFMLDPASDATTVTSVTGGPEGVAATPSGIYVAQQNLNAIVEVIPQRRTVATFPNRTSNAGIDGIAVGATSEMLLVPDSPHGTLIAVSLNGAPNARVIATHLGRPVSATVGNSGDTFVASESSPGLVEIAPDGSVRSIGAFTDLDEVVYHGGLLYVTELNRHDMVAVDPTSGASAVLAFDLPAPQGLAVTAQGTLEVVDATTNTLYSLPACGIG
ncbi:MAG: hypothetical protein WCB51_01470 [Candidatus Dormiibacterota bacterium]